jgi:hypothetical protein
MNLPNPRTIPDDGEIGPHRQVEIGHQLRQLGNVRGVHFRHSMTHVGVKDDLLFVSDIRPLPDIRWLVPVIQTQEAIRASQLACRVSDANLVLEQEYLGSVEMVQPRPQLSGIKPASCYAGERRAQV